MSADLHQRVHAILNGGGLDEEAEFAKTEAIEALIGAFGWDPVRASMFALLRDDGMARHWRVAMYVFWGAVLDRREIPADELIAWLYYRFDPRGDSEDDNVWGITSKLKGVGYLSKYEPLRDPAVRRYFDAIKDPPK